MLVIVYSPTSLLNAKTIYLELLVRYKLSRRAAFKFLEYDSPPTVENPGSCADHKIDTCGAITHQLSLQH